MSFFFSPKNDVLKETLKDECCFSLFVSLLREHHKRGVFFFFFFLVR